MAGEFTTRLEGFEGIEEAWLQLANDMTPRRARTAVNPALRRALRPVRDDIETNTPIESGTLRNSIHTITRQVSRSEQSRGTFPRDTVAVVRTGWFPNRTGGYSNVWFIGLAVEFGTRYQAPQSVLRNALRSNVNRSLNILSTELFRSIERRAERFARTGR